MKIVTATLIFAAVFLAACRQSAPAATSTPDNAPLAVLECDECSVKANLWDSQNGLKCSVPWGTTVRVDEGDTNGARVHVRPLNGPCDGYIHADSVVYQ